MNKKTKSIIFILISLLLIIGSTTLNINTIKSSKERIVVKNNNEPIKFESSDKTIEGSSSGSSSSQKQNQTNSFSKKEIIIIIITTSVAIICTINLLITKFGTISILESLSTTKRIIYYSIIIVLLISVTTPYIIVKSDKLYLNTTDTKKRDEKSLSIINIKKEKTTKKINVKSDKDNTSVIQVTNQGNYTLSEAELNKVSGLTTDKEASIYYGLNSGVLVRDSSTINLNKSKIHTYADYSTGLFARGLNTTANIDNVNIETVKSYSNGIVASDSALVSIDNSKITTFGSKSPALRSIIEKSEIIINNSEIITSEKNSPLIHSSGKLTATNITGKSYNSHILTSDALNNITIKDSNFTSVLSTPSKGLINLYTEMEKYERILYNNASFTIEDSSITLSKNSPYYEEVPVFYITNTDININVNNTKINYGSNILFNITSNEEYGDKDDNSASVIFTSNDQDLTGDIILDEKSSINIFLNNTNYKGKINNANASKKVNIVLDKTTKWELTGDSYISVLTLHNGKTSRLKTQIDSNGYDIYYDRDQNDWLDGQTIKLPGGGKLKPITTN